MIAALISWYRGFIEDAQALFTAESYRQKYGISDRFPSLLSIIFRFLLKHLYIVFPVVWVLTLVIGAGEDIPFVGKLIVSPIAAILYCVMIFVVFLILMLAESFSKIMASLILFNELPQGAENPADALLMSLVTREF